MLLWDVDFLSTWLFSGVCYLVLTLVAQQLLRRRRSTWVSCPKNVGMLEAVKRFSGPEAPMFLLEVARAYQSSTFRLPLPVSWNGAFVVGDGKLAREIMLDATTDKPRNLYKSFDGITDKQIMFTSTNTMYMKTLRKGTAHAFSRNEISRMNTVARKYVTTHAMARLAEFASSDKTFDPSYEMNLMTFLVICEAAFEYQAREVEFQEFFIHIEIALREFTFKQSTNPLRGILWILLPGVREALDSSELVRNFVRKMLHAYQRSPRKTTENTLVKLVDENTALDGNEDAKVAELLSWLTAGHDTTGYSLSNLLVLLAKHQIVQQKLRKELKGQSEPHKNQYFQYVVKEANRLVPVAAMGPMRSTGRAFKTNSDGIIPKGAVCFLPQYVSNHDANIFSNPEEFIPERWGSASDAMKSSVSPFAVGARNCPGQALSLSEINTTVPLLIETFSFELIDEGKLDHFLTLKFMNAKLKVQTLK